MGFSGADIVCFPLMQTLFTSALGMGLAFALYAAVAGVINALFPLGAELGAVCRLSWAHVGGAAGRRARVVPAGRPAAEPFVQPPFTFRGYPQ